MDEAPRSVGPRGFSGVDQSGSPDQFVQYLDAALALPAFVEWKRRVFERTRVSRGLRVLDVGCGTGEDSVVLAKAVGDEGLVLGVDISQTMVEEARKRAGGGFRNLRFEVRSALDLGLPDASFDRVRSDRLLQHLSDPRAALREMVRVVKPGGWVTVGDFDWGPPIIDSDDSSLAQRLLSQAVGSFTNPWSGRRLFALMKSVGLQKVAWEVFPFPFPDFGAFRMALMFDTAIQNAVRSGSISQTDANLWMREQEERSRDERFLCLTLGFIASGLREP